VDDWQREAIHHVVESLVAELEVGFGKVAMPLRLAATGGQPAPDLDLTLQMIGKQATLRRIDKAIAYINTSMA
jgi:glutamyl-tRNA synthetase